MSKKKKLALHFQFIKPCNPITDYSSPLGGSRLCNPSGAFGNLGKSFWKDEVLIKWETINLAFNLVCVGSCCVCVQALLLYNQVIFKPVVPNDPSGILFQLENNLYLLFVVKHFPCDFQDLGRCLLPCPRWLLTLTWSFSSSTIQTDRQSYAAGIASVNHPIAGRKMLVIELQQSEPFDIVPIFPSSVMKMGRPESLPHWIYNLIHFWSTDERCSHVNIIQHCTFQFQIRLYFLPTAKIWAYFKGFRLDSSSKSFESYNITDEKLELELLHSKKI